MKNKTVGIIIIAISLLIGFIVFSFNRALISIVNTSCSHGATCPMWGTINFQTSVGIGIMVLVVLFGFYFVFFEDKYNLFTKVVVKEKEVVKPKDIKKENYKKVLDKLKGDENKIFKEIIASKGNIFQSELVKKTELTKVKITRVLDKLEGKGLIERKRRGMTNIVLLKH